MLKRHIAPVVAIDAQDVEPDIFMPVGGVDVVVRGTDDKLPFFVIHKLLHIAISGTRPEFYLHKNQDTVVLHDQVDFRMFVPVVGLHELVSLGLQPFRGELF